MSIPGGREALLFDLDGTLVDSVPDMADAVDRTLEHFGLPPAGEERVRIWVGDGAREMLVRALDGGAGTPPDEAVLDEALAIFLDCYRQRLYVRSRVYPGVREGLDRLAEAGYRMACVTNKREFMARGLVAAAGLDHRLPIVVGSDTTESRKPSPVPLRHALELLGVPVSGALMVGDSGTDVAAARNAGMPVVCVPYGYNRGIDIHEAGADLVVDDMMALYTLLQAAA